MRKLVVFGAGGFGQEAVWLAEAMNDAGQPDERWEILGYLDDDSAKQGRSYYGYPVLPDPEARDLWYHCAVGSNAAREKVVARLDQRGWKAATLIHPSVIRAREVLVGEGCYIGPGSILSPVAKIGRHVLINQRVSVGHDAVIGDFAQLCPGAQINGRCQIERLALVGSNASIHQGKRVGEAAVVGSNSQVITNVEARTSVGGVPARLLFRE
jgi:sugar O-acyltransferase (sialic acid O-acetyltransferase NeuD family)